MEFISRGPAYGANRTPITNYGNGKTINKTGYEFYLGDMLLPVTPSAMKIKINNRNKTLVLINDGEINTLRQPGLSDISFSALLPSVKYPFSNGNGQVETYLNQLEQLKNSCKPFQFRVIRQGLGALSSRLESKLQVSLESYEIVEDAEKYGFDVMVDINLKQYRNYASKIITFNTETQTATETTQRDTSTAPAEKTYTVQNGDCLRSIAKKMLGDENRWKELYEANVDVMEAAAKKAGRASSSNGYWIYTGTVLKIPGGGS